VGGGKPTDAAQLLIVQPVLWAALVGLVLNAAAVPLPGSVAAVAAALAPANKPLMLLSAGMMLQPAMPQPRQVCLSVLPASVGKITLK
jgi:predicted permease